MSYLKLNRDYLNLYLNYSKMLITPTFDYLKFYGIDFGCLFRICFILIDIIYEYFIKKIFSIWI